MSPRREQRPSSDIFKNITEEFLLSRSKVVLSRKQTAPSRFQYIRHLVATSDVSGLDQIVSDFERKCKTKGRCSVCGNSADCHFCAICEVWKCAECDPENKTLPFLLSPAQTASGVKSISTCHHCGVFVRKIQRVFVPLSFCEPCSVELLRMYKLTNESYTSFCGRVSNYDGIVRLIAHSMQPEEDGLRDYLVTLREQASTGVT
jgi:hypothetical protein